MIRDVVHEIQLTEDHVDRLGKVGQPWSSLDDQESLRALWEGVERDPVLRSLGVAMRTAIHDADLLLLRNAPTDSDPSIMALFQMVAIPSAVGNGGGLLCTVAPKAGEQDDISDSDSEFPPHTDSTFLREPHHFVALACVERDPHSGGESRVLYVDALRSQIETEYGPGILQRLAEPAYPFYLQDPLYGDGVQVVPIFTAVDGKHAMRFRYDCVEPLLAEYPQTCPEQNQEALETLKNFLGSATPHEQFTLNKGDILMFDNRRLLHARTHITPGAVRVLQRLKGFAATGPGFEILP
jgi:Taurine catabolism dioxygenase TauD, TfdA family